MWPPRRGIKAANEEQRTGKIPAKKRLDYYHPKVSDRRTARMGSLRGAIWGHDKHLATGGRIGDRSERDTQRARVPTCYPRPSPSAYLETFSCEHNHPYETQPPPSNRFSAVFYGRMRSLIRPLKSHLQKRSENVHSNLKGLCRIRLSHRNIGVFGTVWWFLDGWRRGVRELAQIELHNSVRCQD
jgi:hypothetical protein